MPALTKSQWLEIQGEYMAGDISNVKIASKYGISDAAIRKRAIKEGWTKNPTKTKREIVSAHFSGMGASNSSGFDARTAMADSANQDIADLEIGLSNARKLLERISKAIEIAMDPRDMKTLAEANRINIDLIRDVRGLKEPLKSIEPQSMDALTDKDLEELEAIAQRLAPSK